MEYTNRPTNNLIEVEKIDVTLVEKGIEAWEVFPRPTLLARSQMSNQILL